MQKLSGKIALVSGSASGIGKAAACLLAREGARVLATDSDAAGAAQTSREITDSGGLAQPCRLEALVRLWHSYFATPSIETAEV
jgi:NAD(P)-dependent dehydrogenase (short-subunit alcohol dehydrogenase family)